MCQAPRATNADCLYPLPIGLLSNAKLGQSSLEVDDTIHDPETGRNHRRKLRLVAPPSFGTPTSRDEEVLLGLIELTIKRERPSATLCFSKWQLAKLLGWPEDAQAFKRISDSLHRWANCTLNWDNGTWSKEDRFWVDDSFQVLKSIACPDDSFWSCVFEDSIFTGLQELSETPIDFKLLASLNSVLSKRLYRVLAVRFLRFPTLEVSLSALAYDDLGLSRTYATGPLKRRLGVAIKELERRGFLTPMHPELRFQRLCKGQWVVSFTRATGPQSLDPSTDRPSKGSRPHGLKAQTSGRVNHKLVVQNHHLPAASLVTRPTKDWTTFDRWWQTLSEVTKQEVETQAVAAADPFCKREYEARKKTGGPLFNAFRQKILRNFYSAQPRLGGIRASA